MTNAIKVPVPNSDRVGEMTTSRSFAMRMPRKISFFMTIAGEVGLPADKSPRLENAGEHGVGFVRDRLAGRGPVPQIIDVDGEAALGGETGGRRADAAAAAGDQQNP